MCRQQGRGSDTEAMNLTELTRQTRRHLAEAGTGVFQDDDIKQAVTRSARDLAGQFRLFHRTTTLHPDGAGRAVLPDDFAGIKEVTTDRGVRLPELAAHGGRSYYGWQGWSYDPADLDNIGQLQVHGRGDTVQLQYWAYPPAPTETREAWSGKYPEYHDLITLHAANQLGAGNGPSAAKDSVWLQRLNQRLDEFRGHLATERLSTRRVQLTSHTTFPSRRY